MDNLYIMLLSLASVLVSTFISTTASSNFSLKGDPCSKFDSCFSKHPLRTCSCDSNCHVYGTCCHDYNKSQHNVMETTFTCYNRRSVFPVFVKRSCSEDFLGNTDHKLACLDDDEDEMDVRNNLLVTSHSTKITYWNKHCAACNKESEDDLELWNIEVFCPLHKDVDRNAIRRNLTFDQDRRQWGIEIGEEFLRCSVKYAPPPYIDEVKHCTPNLISSCPANYTNEDTVTKCLQYYAERKAKCSDIYYKNIHCAICNSADVKGLECPGMPTPEDNVDENDFQDMVEEIFTKGDWLSKEPGKRFKCSSGFAYDPLRKNCRRDTYVEQIFPTIQNSSNSFREQFLAMLGILLILMC